MTRPEETEEKRSAESPSPAEPKPTLLRKSYFLSAKSVAALEELALEDPVMMEAKQALEEISRDPEVLAMLAARELEENRATVARLLARHVGQPSDLALQRLATADFCSLERFFADLTEGVIPEALR